MAGYAVAYAPVLVPAAITAGAAISAGFQAYFFGQGIKNLAEGNQQGFQQSVANQQLVVGISSVVAAELLPALSSQSAALRGITANKAQGDAFEAKTLQRIRAVYPEAQPQLTVKTNSGIKTRLDIVAPTGNNSFCLVECKSSATAPLTKNQSLAFPEIQKSGGVIVGNGKPDLQGGTVIPPTEVNIIRP